MRLCKLHAARLDPLIQTIYHGKRNKSTRIFPCKIVGLSKQSSCNHAHTVLCFASQDRQSPPVRSLLTLTTITRFCQNVTKPNVVYFRSLKNAATACINNPPRDKLLRQTLLVPRPATDLPRARQQPLAVSRGRGLARTLM